MHQQLRVDYVYTHVGLCIRLHFYVKIYSHQWTYIFNLKDNAPNKQVIITLVSAENNVVYNVHVF